MEIHDRKMRDRTVQRMRRRPRNVEHIMLNCLVLDDVRQKQADWSDTWKNPNIALNLWNI